MAKIAGRQVEIGIGIETSAGTPVSAANYFKWDSFSMQSVSDKIMLESARGIRNKNSNSMILRKYGKGSLEFVPTVDMLPYVLGMTLGSRSTALRTGETGVYDHTFTVQNNNAAMKTATLFVKQGGNQTERYANCVVDSFDLSVDKEFAKVQIGLLSAFPDTSSISPSYTQDTLYTRNELSVAFGTSLSAALGTNASSTITSTGTNPSDGDTVTIGTTVYRFKNTLAQAYDVKIGASASITLDNFKAAINATGTPGTEYFAGTLAHPSVNATTKTATTLLVVANVPGTLANSIATTDTSSQYSWPGATMNSGTPGTDATTTPLAAFSLSINNNVLFDDAFLSGAATPVTGGYIAGTLNIKGSYTVQFSDTVELAKYQANTKRAMVITMTGAAIGLSPLSFERIQLKLGRVILTKAPLEYSIDGLTMVKQEFEVEYDATDLEMSAVVTNTYAGTNYQ